MTDEVGHTMEKWDGMGRAGTWHVLTKINAPKSHVEDHDAFGSGCSSRTYRWGQNSL